jgi:hypothetical protein
MNRIQPKKISNVNLRMYSVSLHYPAHTWPTRMLYETACRLSRVLRAAHNQERYFCERGRQIAPMFIRPWKSIMRELAAELLARRSLENKELNVGAMLDALDARPYDMDEISPVWWRVMRRGFRSSQIANMLQDARGIKFRDVAEKTCNRHWTVNERIGPGRCPRGEAGTRVPF